MDILVSNYTNKHILFNKGEYIGHLEPAIEEMPQTTENPDVPTMHSITTEKNDVRKGRAGHFHSLPQYKLWQHIETRAYNNY